MRPPRVLTWHVHGSYLYYLTQARCHFYLPVQGGLYGGRTPGYRWGDNVFEVPAEEVAALDLDCILYQSKANYLEDQYTVLSSAQRRLPRVYLEHDPPREHPTDTRHVVDDPEVLLVHVTHFNDLMWDSGRTPTRVVEHGVKVPDGVRYTGELRRGVVVINNLRSRGRRLGADIFESLRTDLPLDPVGMGAEELGGLGALPHSDLLRLEARYRFLLNPIRYTSLGLAVCEAMTLGLPILGLATTEMVRAVENGVSGFLTTNVRELAAYAEVLLDDPEEARRLGAGAREAALERFHIDRFRRDWEAVFREVTG